MKRVRALGAVALAIAVLAAGVAVCPCGEQPTDRDHGCCAEGAALRAAGSECCAVDAALGLAAAVQGAPALPPIDVVGFPPAAAPARHQALRRSASRVSASPPTVLRI